MWGLIPKVSVEPANPIGRGLPPKKTSETHRICRRFGQIGPALSPRVDLSGVNGLLAIKPSDHG